MQQRSRAKRWRRLLAWGVPCLVLLPSTWARQEPVPEDPPAAEVPPAQPEDAPSTSGAPAELPSPGDEPALAPASTPDPRLQYLFLEDRDALLRRWLASGRVERLELGTSAGGRELFGVQFGAEGPLPLAQRATIFLLGGLDGVSLSGSQAVLATVDALLEHPESLPAEATFVAIPWANADGLARWRSLGTGGGRNDRALDDDGDGLLDEDGPDDLDRDGLLLEMLIEDWTGGWVRSNDPRFLRAAREGEAPRYLRFREGADDDGDGLYNEDGPGGVLLDRNFPIGWEDCRGPESGPWPLSEPDASALAQLLLARRAAVVLVFQGNHGLLASPGGRTNGRSLPTPEDGPTYQRLAEVFGAHTGRTQPRVVALSEAHGEPWPGSLVDWSYAALGALAMEIGTWGPGVEAGARGPVDAYYKSSAENGEAGVHGVAAEEAWARWLDNSRGGIGFMDWSPIQLPKTPVAFVGGWEPYTMFNPPLDALGETLHGIDAFVLDLARNLPRLEIDLRESKREGKVCLIKARVKNLGTLPSGAGPGAESGAVRLRLEITPGVTLRAGQLENVVGHLPGRGTSDEYGWLLIAPEGSVLNLVVESAWSPPAGREVRL